VTVGPLGFLLNNEMDDFAAKPGVPNLYGLVHGAANAIGPNRRPLSAMTPTIVLKDGKLWLVLGAEDEPTIITNVANMLMGVADYGLGYPGGSECAAYPPAVAARPHRVGAATHLAGHHPSAARSG
jgi:gamma-glutamyltranspeptidase